MFEGKRDVNKSPQAAPSQQASGFMDVFTSRRAGQWKEKMTLEDLGVCRKDEPPDSSTGAGGRLME